METEDLHRQFTDHQFSCYRSSRYWAAREIFWRFIDHLCKLLIFVTSAGAVCIKAIGGDPAAIGWIAAAALSAYILESFAVLAPFAAPMKQQGRRSPGGLTPFSPFNFSTFLSGERHSWSDSSMAFPAARQIGLGG